MIKNIRFEGLERISPETVENYLQIKKNHILSSDKTSSIIRELYKTGFFENISLSRENNTLIIHFVERPTIGELSITGNSVIPTDKLTPVMKSLDIAEGRIYNPAVVDRIKQGLLNQYYQLGRYNARITISTEPLPRNRLRVRIEISEGLIAKIRNINIIGNHVFSERKLLKQLDISTSNILTLLTQQDRYSEIILEQNIEKLREFYLDHGFLRFEVKSAQASMTPDRRFVYITIIIEEGMPFTIKNFEVAGTLPCPKEDFTSRLTILPGETFSRSKVVESEKAITKFLGEKGYLFASINLKPKINEANNEVSLLFDVNPGKKTYVRHVTFSDNVRTNDVVLRREVEQMESAPACTTKIEESKQKLSLLSFVKNVDLSVNPVPGVDDQIDVDYKVVEDSASQATFKLSYSGTYGIGLGAGINQKNFLGTGNLVGIDLQRNQYEQYYSINYTNPYYTEDGISRSLNFSISRIDPGRVEYLNSGYATDEYNLGLFYTIPVGQEQGIYNRIIAGAAYQNILVNLDKKNPGRVSNQVSKFIDRHGERFQELDLRLGYSRDSRDKAIFPTSGSVQSLFADTYAPLSHGSLSFYTLTYHGKWYQPLFRKFILTGRTDLGYGNAFNGAKNYPFFKNFYAGGIDSVRGYAGMSLGPLDSNGQSYGGNMLLDASLAVIFPNPFSENVRTSAFVDAGNVYSILNNRSFGCHSGPNGIQTCSTNSGPLRYSVGVEVDVILPLIGPVKVSLAKPINPHYARANQKNPGDRTEPFQFALGANF